MPARTYLFPARMTLSGWGTGGDRIVVVMFYAYVIRSKKDSSLYKGHFGCIVQRIE